MFQSTLLLARSILTISLTTLVFLTCAQGTFQIGIGTPGYERGSCLRQLTDGGFIIGGYTESHGLPEADMLLIRTDASGNMIWTKTFGGPEREVINDVVQTSDLGFIAISEKYQPNKKEGEFLTLLKTDASGNLIWKKIYDEGGNETEGFSIAATPDGKYVITGIVKSMNIVSDAFFTMRGEDQNLFLLKVDENGNKIWSRNLSSTIGNITSTGVSVIVATDGSYIITGNVTKKGRTDKKIEKPVEEVNEDDSRNMLLVKVSPDGALVWAREYSANRITVGFSLVEKKEGGFVVAGICTPDETNNIDYFVTSLTEDGSILWSKTIGGSEFDAVSDVLQDRDGAFLICGMTYSFGAGASDALMLKIDNNGNLQWAKTYGTQGGEYGTRMAIADDGIVLTGEATVGKESFDVLFIKTDPTGNSGCLGMEAAPLVNNFSLTVKTVENASMQGVEQGISPPNFKKADVNNIEHHERPMTTKSLCN